MHCSFYCWTILVVKAIRATVDVILWIDILLLLQIPLLRGEGAIAPAVQ